VFANGTYRFVVLRHFKMSAGERVSDPDVLAMLIQNSHYRGPERREIVASWQPHPLIARGAQPALIALQVGARGTARVYG
jgi:hypothetical protein